MDDYVGPYRILRLIDRGGQGSVYLGYDKRLHRRVAIKIYSLPTVRLARKKLLREARLVASMQSPKVVQIHDVIESSTHLGLVMEYVPGCSLEDFLQRVRPSLGSVLTVGADIAGALTIARQQHIVHGDLKAGNILLTEYGRAKLTDFGISRDSGQSASRHQGAGSLCALSPEQYLGHPVDERADLFTLGCVLYRMLSGEQPFYRDGQLDADALARRPPPPLETVVGPEIELPGPLLEVIGQLLQKDPQRRPANTRRVRQVLRLVARGIPMSAANSLLPESRPCFRRESPQDIPPQVPVELGRRGRSRLVHPAGHWAGPWHRLLRLGWPARTAAALGLLVILSVPLVIALHSRVTAVEFEEPFISFTTDIDLPAGVSRSWLIQEIKQTVQGQLGELHMIGQVGADPPTTIYSEGTEPQLPTRPDQVYRFALRCFEQLCVFTINREHADISYSHQAVILADMSIQQWRDTVRSTTLALYP